MKKTETENTILWKCSSTNSIKGFG